MDFLPNPAEVSNTAFDSVSNEEIPLETNDSKPFVGLAFKLEEGKFGQLTYVRIYQGQISRADTILNTKTGKKVKVPRLVRMHSNEMEDVNNVGAGEICAMFGVECSSGDTFTDGSVSVSLTSIFVPDPVISLSVKPKAKSMHVNFAKAMNRFQREDPTFRISFDEESKETIISGMGELHLEIYLERMKREYGVECEAGKPTVAFRETIEKSAKFDYIHKKQSGGSGQFGKVTGYIEPCINEEAPESSLSERFRNEFSNMVVGGTVPTCYIPACEKVV